ncbi:MAG: hypothetical protein IJ407_00695 [Clostridia bacterium]|nr:hypothetical protein [Clostridia bacterium]MBQ8599888.1 hypothetical protein [Clostridia bacterium]
MKQVRNILWGVVLIAIGVVLALNVLGVTDIDLLFDGWWTLFIIVPCTIGLFTEADKTGNLIGIAVGVTLMAACQDWIAFDLLWKLLVPVVIILIGLRLIFKDFFDRKAKEGFKRVQAEAGKFPEYGATFSGQNLDYSGLVFEGVKLTAVFGGVKCDLREAIIQKDAAIEVCAIFGGVDVLLPENVNVRVATTSIFGGVSNKHKSAGGENAPTVYVTGTCLFGGADIK